MKSQNHNKNTGADVRKNNRINYINTQCPKGKSVSPERHSPAMVTEQQIQPAQRSSPDPPPKLNDNRPSHKLHKKKKRTVQAQTRRLTPSATWATVLPDIPDQSAPTPK